MRITMLTLLFVLFTVSVPQASAGGLSDWGDSIKEGFKDSWKDGTCTQDSERKRKSCRSKNSRKYESNEKKREQIENQFVNEYIKLSGYKKDRANAQRDAQNAMDRKVYLELKRDAKGLSKDESRELSRSSSAVISAENKARSAEKNIIRSQQRLASYENNYRKAGGHKNLVDVAREYVRQTSRY